MRDIAKKTMSLRNATAEATFTLRPDTIELIIQSKIPKGEPISHVWAGLTHNFISTLFEEIANDSNRTDGIFSS